MNILLTSAGRRNYMVDYFKEVVKPYNGKVYAMNSNTDAPALWVADGFVQAPLIYDPSYKDFLLRYCKEKDIQIVISLFDIELPILAQLKQEFKQHGITIIVSEEWLTTMANDKWKTQEFLNANGFNTVATFLNLKDLKDSTAAFPVFIKPRWGMGSMSIFKAENTEEATFYFKKAQQEIKKSYLKYESATDNENAVLIQEAMPGVEYGLDIINDLNGNYCNTVVKQKLAMRSGETDGAITVHEPLLMDLGAKLAKLTKHPGNMDVDVFFDGTTPYILELNPRFGGGYPFSHAAGVNVPQAIVAWYRQEQVNAKEVLTPRIGVKTMKGITMISERDGK